MRATERALETLARSVDGDVASVTATLLEVADALDALAALRLNGLSSMARAKAAQFRQDAENLTRAADDCAGSLRRTSPKDSPASVMTPEEFTEQVGSISVGPEEPEA